jgi:hypothetical protein
MGPPGMWFIEMPGILYPNSIRVWCRDCAEEIWPEEYKKKVIGRLDF